MKGKKKLEVNERNVIKIDCEDNVTHRFFKDGSYIVSTIRTENGTCFYDASVEEIEKAKKELLGKGVE